MSLYQGWGHLHQMNDEWQNSIKVWHIKGIEYIHKNCTKKSQKNHEDTLNILQFNTKPLQQKHLCEAYNIRFAPFAQTSAWTKTNFMLTQSQSRSIHCSTVIALVCRGLQLAFFHKNTLCVPDKSHQIYFYH